MNKFNSFQNLLFLIIGLFLVSPKIASACTIASGVGADGHVWNANNEDGPKGVATFINVFPKSAQTNYGYYTLSHFSPKNGEGGNIQGGMNEAGLTFDFNSIDQVQGFNLKNKKAFPQGDGAILPHILASMSSLQEVMDFFETYWFQNGFQSAQMHVADRQGRFAIISASGMKLAEKGQPLVSTNFDICGKEDGSTCWRYPIAMEKISTLDLELSTMESIIRETSHEGTMYSNIQNLSTGEIWFYANPYKNSVKINLSELLAKGQKSYAFDDLQSLVEERPVYEWVKPNPVSLPKSILDQYVGNYITYTDFNIAVRENEGGIVLSFEGEEIPPMLAQSETEFFQESGDFRVKFELNKMDYKMVMTFYEDEFWSFQATKDLTSEMLEKIISEEPDSARAHYALGDVQQKSGNLKAALASYQRCIELDPDDHNAVRNLQWIKESLEISENPITVPSSVLTSYEGQYEVRKITFRDGKLYYQREGNEENLLIPLSQDTFALEKSDTFRLRFLQENDGTIRKIIGIYIDGKTDESLRNDF
ncbi:DUF3471 domain-containing protein [Litoribacter populi]|uniref:DUF3471 domain-containing protein n=1 Tax=Litoribacter populi TaxID=2598460 RepID=UPI001181625C|nr:DUF3471 domain-containing protein [Litoribacter populi]